MKLAGWGNFPVIDGRKLRIRDKQELRKTILVSDGIIPFGNGRSYGDSALAETILDIKGLSYFLGFDDKTGLLHVQGGVLLRDILDVFVPKGWFLAITPGTKLITVGGAIASDVHGKNHHKDGCFSESVDMMHLMLPDGEIVHCSRKENRDLFLATCGGMGLTGVIVDAKIKLKKIPSAKIKQTTTKTANLNETFEAFEQYSDSPYSVAWIDCLAGKKNSGRSLLVSGDFLEGETLDYSAPKQKSMPVDLPSFWLNRYSVKAFNQFYYHKVRKSHSVHVVGIDPFFYPLDVIGKWNRIYGKSGFTQYQFILPKEASYEGLKKILTEIGISGKGSFLAVLKLYGPQNKNWLSFPLEGYSLALDFKIDRDVFNLLDRLDHIVIDYGGRIYLTKDARVSKVIFEKGYPDISKFRALRKQYRMDTKFQSLQSKRLEL